MSKVGMQHLPIHREMWGEIKVDIVGLFRETAKLLTGNRWASPEQVEAKLAKLLRDLEEVRKHRECLETILNDMEVQR